MAVVIRLQRTGKPKQPYYRVVAIEKSRGSAGRPIEIIGWYDPRIEKRADKVTFDAERYAYWKKNGAKPSPTVETLLKGRTGEDKAAAGGKKS